MELRVGIIIPWKGAGIEYENPNPNSRGHTKVWESITPTPGATPKRGSPQLQLQEATLKHGSPSPQLKGPHRSVGVHNPNLRGHKFLWIHEFLPPPKILWVSSLWPKTGA